MADLRVASLYICCNGDVSPLSPLSSCSRAVAADAVCIDLGAVSMLDDRRALDNQEAENIVIVWKAFLDAMKTSTLIG